VQTKKQQMKWQTFSFCFFFSFFLSFSFPFSFLIMAQIRGKKAAAQKDSWKVNRLILGAFKTAV